MIKAELPDIRFTINAFVTTAFERGMDIKADIRAAKEQFALSLLSNIRLIVLQSVFYFWKGTAKKMRFKFAQKKLIKS